MLVFSLIFVFSACGKDANKPAENTPHNEEIINGDEETNNDEEEEIITQVSASDLLLSAQNFSGTFFDDYEFNLEDEFDNYIYANKTAYINATSMIGEIANIDGIRSGWCVSGKELQLNDYNGVISKVDKFFMMFSNVDESGNCSVEVQIVFGYHDLSITKDYDFYYFKVEFNTITKNMVFDCRIEKSHTSGTSSAATYYIFSLDGTFDDTPEFNNYTFYGFDRTAKINEVSSATINNNYIKNMGCAKCYDGEKTYSDPDQSDQTLNNPSSDFTADISEYVGSLNQYYNSITGGSALGTIENLSERLVIYDNVSQEIHL